MTATWRTYRYDQIRPFMEMARTRRVDVAVVGDSNVYTAGNSGYLVGFTYAWGRRFGFYATSVVPVYPSGSGGIQYEAGAGLISNAPSGSLPAQLSAYTAPSSGMLVGPWYMMSGTLGSTYADVVMVLEDSHPLGLSAAINWRYSYYAFTTGSGHFRPIARQDSSVNYAAISSNISTSAGSYGLSYGTLTVPAGSRSGWSQMWFAMGEVLPAGGNEIVGPVGLLWHRAEWPDQLTGVGVSTLLAQGGQGTRAAAATMQECTQAQFDAWCQMVCGYQLQTIDKQALLLQIPQGGNDYGDTATSVGPLALPSNTIAGSVDNFNALVIRTRELWVASGRSLDNLFFVSCYHTRDSYMLAWFEQLDDALAAFSDTTTNVAVQSRTRLSTLAAWAYQNTFADAEGIHFASGKASGFCDFLVRSLAPPGTILFSYTSGATLDVKIFDDAGFVWDSVGYGFVPVVSADVARYAIPVSEIGSTGTYSFDPPIKLLRSVQWRGLVTLRSGGTAAWSDSGVKNISPTDYDGVKLASLAAIADDGVVAASLATQAKSDVTASVPTVSAIQSGLATAAALAALAAKYTGITSLRNWLMAIARKANNDATAIAEINANNGTGTGTYDPTTDSQEAIADDMATPGDVSVVFAPVQATTGPVDPKEQFLKMSQYSTPTIPFNCIDDNGDPIDLTGKSISFVAATTDGVSLTTIFTRTSAAGQITVSGAADNVANVTIASSNTATARERVRWWLWDLTSNVVLANGVMNIPPSVQS